MQEKSSKLALFKYIRTCNKDVEKVKEVNCTNILIYNYLK